MKPLLDNINKAFENKARLGIMSVLSVSESVSFVRLKELLGLSDGNLASHIRGLEEAGYLTTRKQFIGRKPHTSFSITQKGRSAFREHLAALEALIKGGV
ncbi:MAG: transcriptional regulator [Rikenellaceae bacterium]|nr:transcriptional regulator [Rikenellaceae bacterium]